MSISIVNTIAVLVSDKRRACVEHPFWQHFSSWTISSKTDSNIGQDETSQPSTNTVEQSDTSNSENQDLTKSQETCAYCSFYEFGWCNFHDKSVASDAELCNEIKQMQ